MASTFAEEKTGATDGMEGSITHPNAPLATSIPVPAWNVFVCTAILITAEVIKLPSGTSTEIFENGIEAAELISG
ncbi:hypothetical protein GCM10011585_30610 [Edaphobacter dinghuensis]|uniref:Uncharacterized protein n=1 Tax=Edaphobacter dinghuensis TaxID=1560005 RepID=A0A917HN60_9BACT|nr:hypothetical protein GCM10011585_30610 [Edaphobacter dinghuensis]